MISTCLETLPELIGNALDDLLLADCLSMQGHLPPPLE